MASREWIRTFAVITTDANQLVAEIHDRMPLILDPKDYVRWLGEETDPRDLMKPFPSEPMRMWPIWTRVNKPENDDPSIVDPIQLACAARKLGITLALSTTARQPQPRRTPCQVGPGLGRVTHFHTTRVMSHGFESLRASCMSAVSECLSSEAEG